ncbi:MAG: TlpA disulfide reductase family protein [Actinomycetota bacterium]|nr:TlpA disulfide reductase family protein [Actinomycetota bacterium]MDA3013793.1 TlpA disulfide reductase family protein [Actinomycetota bacterium]
MNKNFIIGGAIVLVVGLAVAIGVSLVDEPLDGNLPEGETTISGDALPEYAGENDINISVGLQAPLFSGPDQNSEIISLEKNGKSKILLFLAHWCPHCQAEVPIVQEYIDTFGLPADVEVIGILTSIDRSRDNYPPHDWLVEEGWSETQIYDLDREIGTVYGLNAFPYWVTLDKDLKVVNRVTGKLTPDQITVLINLLINQ